MDYQLLVVRGRSALEALSLLDGVTTVGRHDSCHIRIKSSQVSRKHCELFEKKGLLLVKDLGSANGTIVNGKKVDGQRVLEPGDELTLGPVSLRVAKIGQAPPVKVFKPAVATSADTAVVEAVSAPVSDDEFEIDFDDEPTVTTPAVPAAANMDQSFEIPFDDEPASAPAPKPAPAPVSATAEPKKDKKSEINKSAQPETALPGADEAIADFLLDIKLDEDD